MKSFTNSGQYKPFEPWKHLLSNYALNIESGCWEWTGQMFESGYGCFKVKAFGGAMHASRASYMLHHDVRLKTKDWVLHECDNPLCINPSHLFLGSSQDNHADMVAKGRISRGVGRPAAKLDDDKVRSIRKRRAEGATYGQLAREFEVSRSACFQVASGLGWKHVA